MEKRITTIKNFISVEECNILLNEYENKTIVITEFLNKKLENYLEKMKFHKSNMSIGEIQFHSISLENTKATFLKESNYDITLLIGLNSDFEGGRFIMLNKETDKNMHMDNTPGDMIVFFSSIEYGSGKIINGTKHYLKIGIKNILNSNLSKSLI